MNLYDDTVLQYFGLGKRNQRESRPGTIGLEVTFQSEALRSVSCLGMIPEPEGT